MAREKLCLTDPKEGSRLYNAICLETQKWKSRPYKYGLDGFEEGL
jgi:hypothetical protein